MFHARMSAANVEKTVGFQSEQVVGFHGKAFEPGSYRPGQGEESRKTGAAPFHPPVGWRRAAEEPSPAQKSGIEGAASWRKWGCAVSRPIRLRANATMPGAANAAPYGWEKRA